MRLHRFYIDAGENIDFFSVGKTFSVISPAHIHQWRDVFRFKTGDEIIVFSSINPHQYKARFIELLRNTASLEIVEKLPAIAGPLREITLYTALIKKERYEWMVEKATEIGVAHFCPLLSERSEIKNIKSDRIKKIIIEATEQSGWSTVPTFHEPITLATALQQAKNPIVCDVTEPVSFEKNNAIGTTSDIFIGPEGGWSLEERELFNKHGVPKISLGHQTLRAETAAIAVASLILLMPVFPKI